MDGGDGETVCRHIRDLVAHTAFKGLDANEIGCARISVMAGEQLPPSKGRIQMSRTNYLQTFKFGLQRDATLHCRSRQQCWRNREAKGPQVHPFIQTRLACTRSDPMSSCGLPIRLRRPVGGVGEFTSRYPSCRFARFEASQ